jgi:protein-disulfide isomerase
VLETEPQLIENFIKPGKVQLVYRHLVQIGEGSQLAAEASECAADQNRFWEMRQALYAQQGDLFGGSARANIDRIAESVGVSLESFGSCMEQRTHQAAVEADFQAATAAGVRLRPVFEIGEKRFPGAQPYGQFERELNLALGGR